MASVKQILTAIVDHPGWSGAQLAEELDMDAKDIQPRIDPYIRQGKVIRDKKVSDGASPINLYYASEDLIRELDGVQQLVTKAAQKNEAEPMPVAEQLGDFVCGFNTAGCITITKGRKTLDLTRTESDALIEFLDCINIAKIKGASA
ncbi:MULTISPECIES: hypothetical protein [Burkholderia]|uniref:hypothetical protein n=1 Tax=Burkholderia TaxID=32008 RepID=UPI000F5E7C08|nr:MULTISPECIES: hypothetical protein [Burkholderia]RQZ74822.1 hypothetical protein DF052_06975 [Burkholderia glumae]